MESVLNAVRELGNGSGSMKDRLEALKATVNEATDEEWSEFIGEKKPIVEMVVGYGVAAYRFGRVTCEFLKALRA